MFSCAECRAIHEELAEASRLLRDYRLDGGFPTEQLVAWLESFEDEESTRIRETSPLWQAWRRREAHRVRSGHSVSLLSLPPERPGATLSQN